MEKLVKYLGLTYHIWLNKPYYTEIRLYSKCYSEVWEYNSNEKRT